MKLWKVKIAYCGGGFNEYYGQDETANGAGEKALAVDKKYWHEPTAHPYVQSVLLVGELSF
jgi:hypothetical protein